jgi:hypothetical protein
MAALAQWQNRRLFAPSLTVAWPKLDLGPLLSSFGPARWLPKAASPTAAFSASMLNLKAIVEASRPPNWPESARLDRVLEVIHDDGLPLAWVPRPSLVQEVLDAEDRATQIAVLLVPRPPTFALPR